MASYNFSPSLLNGYQASAHEVKNPFADPSHLSRTTASGFTDNNHLVEEFEAMKMEGLNQIEEMVEINEMPNSQEKMRMQKELSDEMIDLKKKLNVMMSKTNAKAMPQTPPASPPQQRMNFIRQQQDLEDDIKSTLTTSTIKPNESASVLKPQRQGTELTMYSGIRSSLVRGSEHDNVVGGYEVSAEDHMIELDAINNIQRVYGLPKIFIDDRLNFLVHLHKPLQAMLTTKESGHVKYPDPNSLEKLTRFLDRSKGRHREPHHELLYQVLKATIDMRRKRFKANPFNLPIIEIGMSLDDQIVYMCISELYSEFRTLWFHSMKNVEPPHFAGDYVGVCSPTRTAKQNRPVAKSRRRGSSSVIGSILSI
jgi:hypothetical protein